jgi:hypothetical protein
MTIHAPTGQGNTLLALVQHHARLLLVAAAFILSAAEAHAQGCVIARGGGGASVMSGDGFLEAKHWQLNLAYRHFVSDRHFIGDVEQPQRIAQGTQVINNSHFMDFTATYAWTKRLNFSFTLPYVTHDRSSKYEHSGNNGPRGYTNSSGIGDISVRASYWLFNPETTHRYNLSVGAGIKFATGHYLARDVFQRPGGPQERYVDSSIQPGDGGVGGTLELNGYFIIAGNLSAYGSAFYLFSPEERVEETNFSIPDSYLGRAGLDYVIPQVKGLSVSLGARIEGVPGHDAFGGNRGSRRPGFSVAVEPGVTYSYGKFSGTITVPIAVHRNRTTTFGSVRAGDAAFADYSINTSFSYRY